MSTEVYKVDETFLFKIESPEEIQFLKDFLSPSDGDIFSLGQEDLEKAVEEAKKMKRYLPEDLLRELRKALKKYGGFSFRIR